ncbi:Late histone H2A.1 [Trichinella nelsoni]|uniref:Histone H2A n=1 Tax=Trichinella nelsoni TaxID=6336 RepID=A0A0V0SI95_9BILA|nr:Late histone H2A.1 [Trichinella nelsoni]
MNQYLQYTVTSFLSLKEYCWFVNSSSKRSNRCRVCRRKIDDVVYLESINSEYGENSSSVFRRKFPERVRAEVDPEMIPHTNEFHNPASEIESNEDGDFIIPYEIIQDVVQDRFPELSVSAGAAVYLSAVLEYLLAELVDISGTAAKKLKRSRIDPWAMAAALSTDEELRLLFESKYFEESTAEKTVYIAHGEIEDDVSSTSSSNVSCKQSKVIRKCILLVYD